MGKGGVPVPKPQSRAAEKAVCKAHEARTKRLVWKVVQARDRYVCRHCGGHPADVHHLKFRSQGGGNLLQNLLLLCRQCHAEIHAYRLRIEGESANQRLRFVRTA